MPTSGTRDKTDPDLAEDGARKLACEIFCFFDPKIQKFFFVAKEFFPIFRIEFFVNFSDRILIFKFISNSRSRLVFNREMHTDLNLYAEFTCYT